MAATPSFRDAGELPALVSYVRERRCVLFVGAGLSRPAGYPGWGELMQQVVTRTHAARGDAAPREELEQLVAQGKFAEVADECRTLLGRARFGDELRSLLARPDALPPEATHRAIVRTPWSCIVTTNFDTLLEDAYARWGDTGIPKAPTGVELAQHGTLLLDDAFFILKAHGTIHDSDSMVFTSEDYRRITHANPAFQAVMSALMLDACGAVRRLLAVGPQLPAADGLAARDLRQRGAAALCADGERRRGGEGDPAAHHRHRGDLVPEGRLRRGGGAAAVPGRHDWASPRRRAAARRPRRPPRSAVSSRCRP